MFNFFAVLRYAGSTKHLVCDPVGISEPAGVNSTALWSREIQKLQLRNGRAEQRGRLELYSFLLNQFPLIVTCQTLLSSDPRWTTDDWLFSYLHEI